MYFSIKRSISSYVSNIRYFIFNSFDISIIYIFFNDIIFTTSLGLLKSAGTGTNLSISNLSTILFKLLKLVRTFFSSSVSSLSTLDFKLTKSTFLAHFDVSTPVAFSKSFLLLHD